MLDNDWARARERLARLERLYDCWTIAHLEQIGVSDGWRCLEVAAVGGQSLSGFFVAWPLLLTCSAPVLPDYVR